MNVKKIDQASDRKEMGKRKEGDPAQVRKHYIGYQHASSKKKKTADEMNKQVFEQPPR
jgi:hypothetical protein